MIILGIDPGSTTIGFGLIAANPTPAFLHAGLVKITQVADEDRLLELHRGMQDLISHWKPHAIAVEKIFFAKNAKTAIGVAQSRGVILLTAALAGLTLYEYTPLEVKKTITGSGTADKKQVQKMVQYTLPNAMDSALRDDVYDAVAIALTCHFRERAAQRMK